MHVTWNPVRRLWETGTRNLMCGHASPLTSTWPAAGTVRGGTARHREELARARGPGRLLPTPLVSDAKTAHHRPGRAQLREIVTRTPGPLLPTPRVSDANGAYERKTGGPDLRTVIARVTPNPDWGQYTPAVDTWSHLTRAVPAPTGPGRNGRPRLAPEFAEWMMGLPTHHVTGVPGLTRRAQIRAIGNGVVPQQAAHALRILLARRNTPDEMDPQ